MTLGVGMVEEACKAMAILGYLKGRPQIGWRQACLCGLATGVGFGISEGIMYSAVFYNGVEDHLMYLVRFASCVSLHAIWSASAAVTLYHSQDLFHFMQEEGAKEEMGYENLTDELMQKAGSILARYGMVILRMVWLVMILHGLYNTFLTVELNLPALLTAIASFAYLAWQIEECRRLEAEGLVPAPAE
jgi:RsiW-degrading membrane proteinase PrsW (M82 family)